MVFAPVTLLLLTSIGFVYLFLTFSILDDIRAILKRRTTPLSHYTWIEDDVPDHLTLLGSRKHVLMPMEESVRFGIHEPEAYDEWLSIISPEDQGNVRLGPNHRFMNVALIHQQHCLRFFRAHLDVDDDLPLSDSDVHHAEHCLSLWREHTLCAADITLEVGDPFAHNFTVQRDMGVRQCMDVEAFYGTMRKHWGDWLLYQESRTL
ncbi:hypothetical protein LXA43DRAFT_191155 [Ganoderma leucocontextum]|nr:hypothetical protein LXA43DRAFT_191155 [Ganoderma leucocontextum]